MLLSVNNNKWQGDLLYIFIVLLVVYKYIEIKICDMKMVCNKNMCHLKEQHMKIFLKLKDEKI